MFQSAIAPLGPAAQPTFELGTAMTFRFVSFKGAHRLSCVRLHTPPGPAAHTVLGRPFALGANTTEDRKRPFGSLALAARQVLPPSLVTRGLGKAAPVADSRLQRRCHAFRRERQLRKCQWTRCAAAHVCSPHSTFFRD